MTTLILDSEPATDFLSEVHVAGVYWDGVHAPVQFPECLCGWTGDVQPRSWSGSASAWLQIEHHLMGCRTGE